MDLDIPKQKKTKFLFIKTNKAKHFNDTHVIQNRNFNFRIVRSCLKMQPTKNLRKTNQRLNSATIRICKNN